MTSHETRTHNTRTKSSEQNDLKKLKSKYSAKLPTLKVLFSDWSDDDLLFVLEEANGDLDLTIDRISEGHANQWGEVKTKKSKKEAQKAKVATTAVSSHQQQSTTTYAPRDTSKITPQRSYNERVTRPGKATAASPATTTSAAPSNRRAQKSSWDTKDAAGSWASIASSKQEQELNNEESWTTVNESSPNDDWSPAPTHNTTNDESTEDQPKTWASLLKSKPKPESEPVPTNTSENTTTENTTTTSEWDAPNTSATNDWSSPPTLDAWSAPTTDSVAPITAAQDEWSADDQVSTEIEVVEKEETVQVNRLVNQEEPVVLPATTTTTTISSLDVKFGSLNVEEEPAVEETVKETTVATAVEPVVQAAAEPSPTPSPTVAAPVAVVAATATPATTTTTPPAVATPVAVVATAPVTATAVVAPNTPATASVTDSFQSSAYLKQEPAYAQAQQQPQQQQPQPHHHHQQQQQQQIPHQPQQQSIPQQQPQFGMDHLTSAYSSYLPNQPPTGVSGFGMNPMGNLPDYGIYGSEAQRAAAMGYYDPTAFSHSPSVTSASAYGSRDKYSQEAVHGQSAGGVPQQQQMYPTNLPYYQYYYMPNQFNAYQQSAYGQPFMNKSMYPTMYQQQQQQQPGKPGAVSGTGAAAVAAGASPYASASPYGQQSQLYNHQSGYDDLNQLGMGLNDYQKSMYGATTASSAQGFLGLSSQQNGQPAQAQAQKASEIRANTSTSAPATQQQQQQTQPQQQPQVQQQQVQQQQQYAQGNYFGQPQMFSYGQYPQQQQQQQQQQHHQQFQQQMPPHGTPSRQQQYWNQ